MEVKTMSVRYDFADLKNMIFLLEGKEYKITEVFSETNFSFGDCDDPRFGEGYYGE